MSSSSTSLLVMTLKASEYGYAREYCYATKYCYANVPDQLEDRNMAGGELLCVRVAILLRSKDASILRVMP